MSEVNMDSPAIQESVRVAVLENLVQPDYGLTWLHEVLDDAGITDPDDETLERVDDLIHAKLIELGRSVAKELTDPQHIATYAVHYPELKS